MILVLLFKRGVFLVREVQGEGAGVREAESPEPGVVEQVDGSDVRHVLGVSMSAQVHLPLEGPAASEAGEGLEARVLPGVGDEVGGLAEGLAAHQTLVRLLTCKRICRIRRDFISRFSNEMHVTKKPIRAL
ncbi:hypothetical protein AVEN_204908-1 [Araneus ventricosus]|uniref:Uncharacterized protein n=1 Tax=Araneus ventricosus TaxID=182803 RepID=A0A4Y2L2P9_ARAVE|nr:hypothetical protein AVEN_204908-1 [Araneus ventricosus]